MKSTLRFTICTFLIFAFPFVGLAEECEVPSGDARIEQLTKERIQEGEIKFTEAEEAAVRDIGAEVASKETQGRTMDRLKDLAAVIGIKRDPDAKKNRTEAESKVSESEDLQKLLGMLGEANSMLASISPKPKGVKERVAAGVIAAKTIWNKAKQLQAKEELMKSVANKIEEMRSNIGGAVRNLEESITALQTELDNIVIETDQYMKYLAILKAVEADVRARREALQPLVEQGNQRAIANAKYIDRNVLRSIMEDQQAVVDHLRDLLNTEEIMVNTKITARETIDRFNRMVNTVPDRLRRQFQNLDAIQKQRAATEVQELIDELTVSVGEQSVVAQREWLSSVKAADRQKDINRDRMGKIHEDATEVREEWNIYAEKRTDELTRRSEDFEGEAHSIADKIVGVYQADITNNSIAAETGISALLGIQGVKPGEAPGGGAGKKVEAEQPSAEPAAEAAGEAAGEGA